MLCARYVRADLPLLDQASRAGLNSVLGVGVALAVIGAAALVGAALVAMRMRKRARYKRAPVAAAPDACARGFCLSATASAGACRCCKRMPLSRPGQHLQDHALSQRGSCTGRMAAASKQHTACKQWLRNRLSRWPGVCPGR